MAGYFSENVLDAVEWMQAGSATERPETLLRAGATSGADTIVGMIAGARLTFTGTWS